MNFQQQMLLLALPLAAIPILIHLINQRRYQTMRWGAMMFLLAANRMSRGYARIRQWLIMACRVLAILGLILAVARPLASGWLGWAGGGKADTTLVLLDRSPSMQQTSASGGLSKLDTGRQQLAAALGTLGSNRWMLIDGISPKPRELDGAKMLADPALAEPVSSAADLPAMLEQAREYIEANQTGRTEIWICSDLRANDWDAEGGRWAALRDSFGSLGQKVRFHLLAYPESAESNLAIRVSDVRRRKVGESAELLVTLRITREGEPQGPTDHTTIPVSFEIEGARSELSVEMAGAQFDLKDHRIPLDKSQVRGWGRVSLPADSNPADNDAYFVFDDPAPRRTAVVVDDPSAARPLELAAAISPDPRVSCKAEVLSPDQLGGLEWDSLGLLVWQAPLPEKESAAAIERFVERGGQVVFLPPRDPTSAELFGMKWTDWSVEEKTWPVESWRADEDLLSNAMSGQSLPVGQLEIRRYCGLEGEHIPLATLNGGAPLLARVATNRGGVYFFATTTTPQDSSLALNGVVLYVMIQRSLAAGAGVLGNTQQLVAGGEGIEDPSTWQRLAGGEDALSAAAVYHRGVYANGDRLYALNRPTSEDQATVLADTRVATLFEGLDFSRVTDKAGSLAGLVQEIWRMFLGAMLIALVGEAALCLPQARKPAATAPGANPMGVPR
ncbi:MAG: BatA domain-containing protein [Planctomycetota bacterium]|nr:BatA domain-containing protein [Planctomycetota bacterium]